MCFKFELELKESGPTLYEYLILCDHIKYECQRLSSNIFSVDPHFNLSVKIAAVNETMFHNQDKISPMSYVLSIASNMKVSKLSLYNAFMSFN